MKTTGAPSVALEHPLSWGQKALWFIERLAPENTAYVIAGAVKVVGPLDRERLEAAFQDLVARHPALATTFVERDGQPVAQVHRGVKVPLTLIDARAEGEEQLSRRIVEEAYRPFDLERGPLVRLALLERGPGEDRLLLAIHHIVSDFWSLAVMISELAAFYSGRGAELPALTRTYAEHVAHQQEMLAGPEGEKLWAFWRQTLAGRPEGLDLPADRPRPPLQTYRGASLGFRLPPGVGEELARLARHEKATLFMALLATFEVQLYRATGQRDLLVGTPTAGRRAHAVANLVGYFVNPVVLRLGIDGDPSFLELLAQVRGHALAAFDHQEFPFPLLVERLEVERDPSRSPIFQVLFGLQKNRRGVDDGMAAIALGQAGTPLHLGDFDFESIELEQKSAQFDLSLQMAELGGELGGTLNWNADLFDRSTMERWAAHLGRIVQAVVADPRQRLSEIPLLTAVERAQLLGEWTATGELPADGATLASLLADQAARTPEAVALVAGEERLSYADLAARGRALAGQLAALGVGPEERVGVCLERGTALAVALWGVVLSGAAYVPLDPTYPRERLGWMLEDSGARLVLSGGGALQALDGLGGFEIVELDARGAWPLSAGPGGGAAAPVRAALPENLAYLIYTSGSTGRPKAVAIEHRSAAALVAWSERRFSAGELEAMLAATSVCFDLSVFELFVPWSRGGRVVLVVDALALASLPGAWEVATINTVPSAMAVLAAGGKVPGSVTTVCLAGEPLTRNLADKVYALPGVERLWDLYGPSEDTTYSTENLVPRDQAGEPTIGRALAGSRAYVTDRWGRPVPVGIPGELRLAGRGLARGYLGRPALTAERFVPEPYGADFDHGEPGARQYTTGDLVRWRADGELEFLGRIDHQVKVRGFRVELGEVEAALLAEPGVKETVVVVRGAEEKRLVGYVAGEAAQRPDEAEGDWGERLKGGLARTLPAYMVPSAIVVLERLPRTPNGKVDRKALPEPTWGQAAEGFVAPRTPAEEMLAELFAEVLKLPRVSVTDNFFRLGGHSLLATQLINRVQRLFGVELPVRKLFETPTVAQLAAWLMAEGPYQAAVLPRLAAAGPASGSRAVRLSFAQERLWFLDRLIPGQPTYNMPAAVRLTGPLDARRLARAVAAIFGRHEVLHSRVRLEGGVPLQQVDGGLALPAAWIDLGALAPDLARRRALALAEEEARRPFDLEVGPLMRFRVARISADEHLAVFNFHHIACDGWSIGVFFEELTVFYPPGADLEALPPALPYAEHAAWQRQNQDRPEVTRALAYWREALAGAPELTDLPLDRPRRADRSSLGATVPFRLAPEVAARLAEAARGRDATLFMALFACFGTLLARLTHQHDLVVGVPVAGRGRPETEGAIGLFVNTLPVRLAFGPNPPFAAILGAAREAMLAAIAHQTAPFEKLVAEVNPGRDLTHSPLFQVLLVLEGTPLGRLPLGDLVAERLLVHNGRAKFDLTLTLAGGEGGLEGAFELDADLLDAATVERWAGHLERIVEAVAADLDLRLSDVPLLSQAERSQLLEEWSPGGELPQDRVAEGATLASLLAAQAAATPEAVALVAASPGIESERLSYAELAERGRTLAGRLAALGVGPEERVGVCFERGTPLAVALWGVVLAGAAYVPLDPTYPRERLAWMLEDSGARLVLSGGGALAALAGLGGFEVVELDSAGVLGEGVWRDGPPSAATAEPLPGNLAYLIYTSGSTGKPKAVAIEGRNAAALVAWSELHFSLSELSPMLAATSVCFDLSVFELFVPWCRGGRVVLVSDALALAELPGAWEVVTVNTVPSAMAALVAGGRLPGSVATVCLAGEPLTRVLAAKVYAAARVERLWNLYGPSEDTTYSTECLVPRGDDGEPTIGRPLAGTRGYVTDRWGGPVPPGVPGELRLAGRGLARGYLGRPALTAERFVPEPLSGEAGARQYKTGDLVRWRSDGDLEFLGRIDHQVKVRGFRVELGEIEAALLAQPGVAEAVVALRDGEEKRLVGYVVGEAAEGRILGTDWGERLSEALARTLPAYMVPSAMVVLSRLPRTPNGKIDRKSLPEPEWGGGAGDEHVAPRNAVEEVLAELFTEVLKLPRVSVTDNFFRLGGHSLLATQLIHRLEETLGVSLPLRQVFETPTVAGLAALAAERATVPDGPRLRPRLGGGEPVLSFAQERLWFLEQLEPGRAAYHLAVRLALSGELSVPGLGRALEQLVRRHEVLRTAYAVTGQGLVQRVLAPPPTRPLPVVDLSGLAQAAAEARRLSSREARLPFDLARGRVLRTSLLRLGATEHELVATVHHIAADGGSTGIFLGELASLYAGQALAPLAIQYGDFAVWQRRWLAGGVLAAQLDYWREALSGAPEVLELPADRPRSGVEASAAGTVALELGAALGEGLRSVARASRATPFMVLLAGFGTLLGRWSGERDLVIGSPIANRRRAGTEELIGFFVNTLALRVRLAGDPSLASLLERVRETTLGAFAHQDLPFERLVEELAPERRLGVSPIFQVMLALQQGAAAGLELSGVEGRLVREEPAQAMFELTLEVEELEHGGFTGRLEYATERFDPATVERLARRFERLLEDALEAPERPLGSFSLLSPQERAELALDWLGTPAVEPPRLAPEWVSAQAAATPDAIAIEGAAEAFSYGWLESRASAVGRQLFDLGVEPEEAVAVLLPPGPELVVTLLGIWKAGAAYLPWSADQPAARMAGMAEDAGVRFGVGGPVAGLGDDGLGDGGPRWLTPVAQGPEPLAPASWARPLEADQVAYVLFTSGSTGRPKGTLLAHAGLARYVAWVVSLLRARPIRSLLQTAPSFDPSLAEILPALVTGGRVVVAEPGQEASKPGLVTRLERHRVTQLELVPSLLAPLLETPGLSSLDALEVVFCGGEALPGDLAGRFVATSRARLINCYGPTEATIDAAWHEVVDTGEGPPPIGRARPGSLLAVLDAWWQPAPLGVPGELWIGGSGLARGYLGRAALTAERFVPDALSGQAGGRLYRTGDRVRRRPDGELEILGRLDFQVKLRGIRVELGEVEAALLALPDVREAVAVVHLVEGDQRLVGYVAADPAVLEPEAARERLAARLPAAMVPSALVVLARLPRTANGKVDRKRLPEPEWRGAGEEGYAAPRTEVEELLAEVFAEVLKVPRVSIHDNFFRLGGHSLLAAQLIHRLEETLGVALPLRQVFETPTVAGLAALAEQGATVPDLPRLRPRRGAGEPVLSFAQERLWFLDRLAPGQPTYNMPAAVRLTGRLDVAAFARAVSEVVARHEVLRSRFVARDGVPHEVVEPPRRFAVPVVALSPGLAPLANELALADARRPFDLERGPLVRAFLVRVAEDEHLFCLDLHHIVCDGWSIGVLVAEIGALYPAFLAGRPSPLPPLPIQYGDFAAWQRRTLAGERLAADLAAWKQRLEGAPERLELPADRPSPPARTPHGGVITRPVPAALLARVEALSAASGGTSFMVLASAFAALLARVSGQREVVLGVPMAGRQRLETEPLIGLFVNTVPLFARLGPGTSFAELVAEMRGTVLDAFSRQDVPFEKLIDELGLARDLGTTPLVQVMFALQNQPMGTLTLPGLELAVEPVDTGTAKFDLTLSLTPEGGGLSALWVFRRDLFDATTVERLARLFEGLLGAVTTNSTAAWDHLPLLGPAERQQLAAEWNDAPTTWLREGWVHRLFVEQVARAPEAVAVEAEGEAWSYGALAARVEALGAVLEALGVGPESLVALLSRRRFDLVAGVLAVLSRGGAYVPLDPAYPAERLAFMLGDSGARVVLAEERWRHLVPAVGHCVVSLDEIWPPPDEPLPEPPLDPDNVAYVIYTSGSTGTPKAVVVQHRAMINRVRFHATAYLAPGERVLQKTSISFDVSVVEVLATLISGAVLVLVTPGQEQDLDALATLMAERQVAHISFPPSQLNLLLERPAFRALSCLEVVVTGGETVPAELADRFTAALPAALDNRYGPTETTVSVLSWRCRPGRPERVLPIGRPIADARVWIVDRRLELVPLGVAGEIAIGGLCVARGYWRRPGRTAESFFPDPFAAAPGARLYRSGDLARRRSDGAIEFLGRLDAQVKIRGFRVELGEIETALSRHPAVGALVVLAVADEKSRTQRLVAWVVPAAGADRGDLAGELRDFLAAELPHYMVPGAFVLLDALPLTPNGKVDRRRLPEPDEAAQDHAYLPPRTPLEEGLAGLFAGVLGRERVGVEDDFFALGGHSLLATQLVARIRDAFGVELPLARLFEKPTVAGLALVLAAELGADQRVSGELGLTAAGAAEQAVLSFGQERMWFLDRLEPGNPAYNLGAAVRLTGQLRTAALAHTLSAIAARHEVLRTTFTQVEGRLGLVVAAPAAQPLPLIDLSTLPAAARDAGALALAAREGARPFDLERGPLMRGLLLRLDGGDHVLIVHLHHVASDGWSMGILVKEIAAFYRAVVEGGEVALPALPLQYGDYARWQRRTLAGDRLSELLAFWRQALAGAPSELELPTDRPRPPLASPAAAYLRVTLPGELLRPLAGLERRTGSTRFMTLLAALDVVLARWSGQRDVVVGAPIAGRQATELEGLIGFFVNSLALRARLDEEASFADLLAQVGRVTLAAYAHQELPFEKLVEELQPARNLASTPIFQVMLALQNVPFSRAELPGLTLSRFEMRSGAAKFDLTLPLAETEGGGLSGELEYRRDLFDPATMERLAGHLAAVLAWAGEHPEAPLARLDLLTVAERGQLAAWNDTARPFPEAAPLPVLIERQVARTPEAVALVFEEAAWSFAWLDEQAAGLAAELVARGVGPGVNVGVFAERSLELVLALVAVGKAGGAYVPLDPDLPRERLAGMIEDARPAVVLVTPGLEGSEV
ncbi:MAG TPA: amino acid adenylation domain-containing protein, partial [Thermoanaerobaculia bacterium]|nr:amino acid adenylation domain-containing protein [Thermoanaerobaculia bacterium]